MRNGHASSDSIILDSFDLVLFVGVCWESSSTPNELEILGALFIIKAFQDLPENLDIVVIFRAVLNFKLDLK